MDKIFYLIPLAGLIGLLYAFYLAAKVSRADAGTADEGNRRAFRKEQWLSPDVSTDACSFIIIAHLQLPVY